MDFDYIIVGAGSAGCVLANRLTSDGENSVLLLEAGPENTALSLKMPAAVLSNLNSTKHNWAFQGEPEPELNGRQIQHDRGKTLGGSSSINGMVFIRGHALDYEGWRQAGCAGWGYADVLPYFKRMETYGGGGDDFRGDSGPLHVHRAAPQDPLTLAFLKAGEEAGYPVSEDISGYCQEGFGVSDRTVFKGERWSTARAYLDPARTRPNLTIMTRTRVQHLVFDGGRAAGVTYREPGGKTITAHAGKEVILSAGAVGSPHLLMLSGVGSAAHLQALGINVVHDLPGVGQNLNDHPDFVLKYNCLKPVSFWPKTRPLAKLAAGLQWMLTRRGIVASNLFEAVGCIRSGPGVEYPDLQIIISPIAVDDTTWEPLKQHAFQIHVGLMRAHSRGKIELRSADPADPPRILVNYLKDSRDRALMRKGIRLVRDIVEQPAFADLKGDEIFPGDAAQSDADLDHLLNTHTTTQWHLSCTARMGEATDKSAVVDASGRVHGLSGLRVVDASIMPFVTNGNTNAPTIMLAEKLSDDILGRAPLPRIEADVWHNPNYETCQR
ncbi:choline dehydrogenase [Roseovarius aestuarii]|uniref:Oxygen-dependent choline dehydrogenase n=1 Tax=Roseovarius aestuarii TaxID=475083 RepID=A0A1X7BP47_9RHOB|nr:choline dehydrogenase [Roseovarius aestuarii]SMC11383.1 Oxygen-dependent choline dehydrogenase [Roseovarius aestuarii]